MPKTTRSSRRKSSPPLAINTVDQLKALADPLRLQLLDQFASGPKTTKQAAAELGLQPTRLYHHVAKLENAGLIKLVKTRRVRGTTEKYYSPVAEEIRLDRSAFDSESAKLAGDLLGASVINNLLGIVQNEVSDYLASSGGLDRSEDETDAMHREVLFAGDEYEIDASLVPLFRKKIERLTEEMDDLLKSSDNRSGDRRKYRLLVGWYPKH